MSIPQFTSELITKEKLNVLVDGINDINEKILDSTITKTVGTGGDFVNLNDALDWCKAFLYKNDGKINLAIKSGYVITSPIFIEDSDLSKVTITSEDLEVFSNIPSGWCITGIRAKMFNLGVLIRANTTTQLGINLTDSEMRILNGCGFIYANVGLQSINSKIFGLGIIKMFSSGNYLLSGKVDLLKDSFIKSGYLDCSRLVLNNSNICIDNIKTREIVLTGSNSTNFSTLSTADTYMELTIKCIDMSNMYIGYNSSPALDVFAESCSRVSCSESLSGLRNIRSSQSSNVNIEGTTFSGTATVTTGGFISAKNSTGTLSQTPNTLTANGIIFK